MQVFPGTLAVSQSRVSCKRIAFDVDDLHAEMAGELLKAPLGGQYLIVAYEIGKDMVDIQEAHTDSDAARNKLMKQMYAIVAEYSGLTGIPDAKMRVILRSRLKVRHVIEKSMSELDEQKLAHAIFLLKTEMHPNSFNYDDYRDTTETED